jgi:hypothetical protein
MESNKDIVGYDFDGQPITTEDLLQILIWHFNNLKMVLLKLLQVKKCEKKCSVKHNIYFYDRRDNI